LKIVQGGGLECPNKKRKALIKNIIRKQEKELVTKVG
jgi:hypothetical protein